MATKVKYVYRKRDRTIQNVTDFDPLSDEARTELAKTDASVKGCRAINVGQGDFTALLSKDDKAFLYFDVGGGCHAGAKSYPWHPDKVTNTTTSLDTRFERSLKPTIFLSHWDHDHWYSAHNATAIAQSKIIAPRQKIAPTHLSFINASMTDLRFWPAKRRIVEYRLNKQYALLIENGKGNRRGDTNYGGVALTLAKYANPQSAHTKDVLIKKTASEIDPDRFEQLILLPGDAPYSYIPTLENQTLRTSCKYVGLIAYHHGSVTKWNAAKSYLPTPKDNKSKSAFTYGIKPDGKGCYSSVPGKNAVVGMSNKGWKSRENTSGATQLTAALDSNKELSPARAQNVTEQDVDILFVVQTTVQDDADDE